MKKILFLIFLINIFCVNSDIEDTVEDTNPTGACVVLRMMYSNGSFLDSDYFCWQDRTLSSCESLTDHKDCDNVNGYCFWYNANPKSNKTCPEEGYPIKCSLTFEESYDEC